MIKAHLLAIVGAGTLGSIVTAFSLNALVRELDLARPLNFRTAPLPGLS
jgi:hypothetical protein